MSQNPQFTIDEVDEETDYGDSFKNYKQSNKIMGRGYINKLDHESISSEDDDELTPDDRHKSSKVEKDYLFQDSEIMY